MNLKKIQTILAVLIVTIIIISGNSMSVTLNKNIDFEKFNSDISREGQKISKHSTGLAPRIIKEEPVFKTAVDNKNEFGGKISRNTEKLISNIIYGYNANCPSISEGPVFFEYDEPGTLSFLQSTQSNNFLSGGAYTAEESWVCCEYGSGVLWEIDTETGDMTIIGGGGISLNGLAWDPLDNQMYGISDSSLYLVDYETGATDLIGNFGDGPIDMIGISFDKNGILYGWDIGTDNLWIISSESGEASRVGPLRIDLNYAQDGAFVLYFDTLYLTAYTTKGQLYTCDKVTGQCTLIGDFQDGAQITASMFINCYCPPHHDIGIKSINCPHNGYADNNLPMQVTVKNYGTNSEITDVNMQVIKFEDEQIIFEEDFLGVFPPDGWTTDYWMKSNTSNACGESPEARCNKNTQYNDSSYYDNYIMTPIFNCSDIEAVKLNYKFSGDITFSNKCLFLVNYRKDTNTPWMDVTPWSNPLQYDLDCNEYEINILGDPYLGEKFQVKWEYIGHYDHFNDWYLDDVKFRAYDMYEEYNQTIENVEISHEQVNVDFPTWTPSDWHNLEYENTWLEYHVKACTLLDDYYKKNDCKKKTFDLYFPWMHDIEITSINSPAERSIPGQVLPVQATIKNVGQYPECCIPINISIGESVILDTILYEESWDTVPPSGWTDEHKNYVFYYGWSLSYSSYAGGTYREARLPYNYALPEKVFYSYALNTSDNSVCQLEFLSYINHYSGQGLYALEAGYSHDGINWFASWHEEPGSSGRYDVSVQFESGYDTTYIGFWLKGDPWYMNYWYIDNVEVKDVDIISEYVDNMCQGPDLEPGEERKFEFDDWTPDFLQYETTDSKDYIIQAEIDMEGDNNPGNDISFNLFTLKYWHDSLIEVTSPSTGREPKDWLGFDDGAAVNALGLPEGGTFQYAIRLTPVELGVYSGYCISSVKRHHSWNTPFTMTGKVKIYEEGTSTTPGALITQQDFSCYEADWHEIYLDQPVEIAGDEDIWVSIEVTHASGQYPAAMDASNNYPGKGDFIYLSSWVEASQYGYSTDWLIRAGVEICCCPPHPIYIKPGIQEIKGLAINFGTFPELDLTCWAEIYDYIDDPENGTLIYEDNITNIDLDEPLGGTQTLVFEDFNFNREGIYSLLLDMPDENDDKPRNNDFAWGIYVDDTEPISTHSLDPAIPDGENGWYVSDVEVTLDAYDPEVLGVSSGVKEIKYKVNNGATQTINGCFETFVVDSDKDNLPVEYWAIDRVGNEESHHTFTIDMDQTAPFIKLRYTYEDGPIPGKPPWRMIFTAFAYDIISQMDRVRFLINNVEQEVISGPGPEYQWEFLYYGGLYLEIYAEAYDNAGNMNSDEIIDPKNINFNLEQDHRSKIFQFIQKTSIIK